MGLGPVFATHRALKLAGMKLGDMELIELNEAFAAQVIACERAAVSQEFFRKHLPGEEPIGEFRRDIVNVNGGAIAVGHPVGSSGLRIVITLLKEMEAPGPVRGPRHHVHRPAARRGDDRGTRVVRDSRFKTQYSKSALTWFLNVEF